MNGLLSFLLREAPALLGGRALIRQAVRRAVTTVAVYAIVGILGTASLSFLYVLIYIWLSGRLDPLDAAAILSGSNLLIAAVILIVRSVMQKKRPEPPTSLAHAITQSIDPKAAVAAGMAIGRKIRKATPKIALGAGLIGLAIGIRPQLIGLTRRRPAADRPKN